ncbi:unnamed protein product [Spodoptera littoralis]|uniref:Sushi domain-containing protein n=1 Tax=Spodoptera littoralis TaxID=7109 RepID=A0A9P0N244_SPOLI|nr:unnamed protein product [Spodoptera littoralis]CAH1639651.1 unnamed protein product [Spodoptera littoralis]
MSIVFIFLIFSLIGTLRARQPDIDINRIKLLPNEGFHNRPTNYHSRRSILTDHNRRNDYDYYSSRFSKLRPSVHFRYDTSPLTEEKAGKVYQPREDPRLFYQSDAYIKETNRKNLSNEVSSIYLGRGVVRADEVNHRRSLPIRMRDNELNSIYEDTCVRCPPDRTLITKPGVDRAVLQYPRLLSCSGRKVPRHVRFVHMYGPKFGSLLKEGSHMIVGRITHKDEILQTCKMQIHVLVQSCSVPKYLVSHCGAENKVCNFTCRDPKAELRGQRTLTCGDDMRWSGHLPVCNPRTWCQPPPPPEHGRVSCKGMTSPNGWGLNDGAICRVRCARGWKWTSRSMAVCRRGSWTYKLGCSPIHTK